MSTVQLDCLYISEEDLSSLETDVIALPCLYVEG